MLGRVQQREVKGQAAVVRGGHYGWGDTSNRMVAWQELLRRFHPSGVTDVHKRMLLPIRGDGRAAAMMEPSKEGRRADAQTVIVPKGKLQTQVLLRLTRKICIGVFTSELIVL